MDPVIMPVKVSALSFVPYDAMACADIVVSFNFVHAYFS
jgi:hypothetical protein